jgi:hypothetical protein
VPKYPAKWIARLFLASTHSDPVGQDDGERTDLSTVAKVADAAASVLQNWPRELIPVILIA